MELSFKADDENEYVCEDSSFNPYFNGTFF